MAENEIQKNLEEGVNAAKRGDRATGRQLLQQVIDTDPNNELAWIWMASCVTTLRERRECLEQVLSINPNNARAAEALQRLDTATSKAAPEHSQTTRDTIDQLRKQIGTAEMKKQPRTGRAKRRAESGREGGMRGTTLALIILLSGLALAAIAYLGISQLGIFAEATSTPTLVAQVQPTEPAELVTFPTNTPEMARGAPTLPPTFTPTPTPTETPLPPPTATPYPLSEFVALYTHLELGASQPALYWILGDGEQSSYLVGNVRAVAFSPDGTRIAFTRQVERTNAETGATEFLPELFIGDVDNPATAVTITDLRASILSVPSWSPDGGLLVFSSNVDGNEELYTIDSAGNNLRRLTDNENIDRDPVWSPVHGDNRIAFASDVGSFGSTELFSITLSDSGEISPYARLTNAAGSSYSPAWSPDGQYIVFISERSGDADVYYMGPRGESQMLITVEDNGAEDRNPSFTPDGRYVVFTSNRQDDRFQSYLTTLRGDVLIRVTRNSGNDLALVYRPEPNLQAAR